MKCIAMLLAGGKGERLGSLTNYYPKPAIHFRGRYRIIDYTLRNCKESGISTIGILSQCFSGALYDYIASIFDYEPEHNGIYMLPSLNNEYLGTADAVFKNFVFMCKQRPTHVLILAADHIYRMDYRKMLAYHLDKNADVTIASTRVPMSEASRYGIINTDINGKICEFDEKPLFPESNLASMGIYLFKWSFLKKYIINSIDGTQNISDFGNDLLPAMLQNGENMYAYKFDGYWRDIGTVDSLWEANMDSIRNPSTFTFKDETVLPHTNITNSGFVVAPGASIVESVISPGCSIFGKVEYSILGDSVTVDKGAELLNSVVMPNVYIGENVKIKNAIIGTRAVIMHNIEIGTDNGTDFFIDDKMCPGGVSLVAPWVYLSESLRFKSSSHINKELLQKYANKVKATV